MAAQDSTAFRALSDVVLAIAAEHEVEPVLQQVVDSARELAGARYAALGIPDGEGAFAVGDAQRGVARAAELARRVHEPLQNGLHLVLGGDRQDHVGERSEGCRLVGGGSFHYQDTLRAAWPLDIGRWS